jgi:hypothetical protein
VPKRPWLSEVLVGIGGLIFAAGVGLVYLPAGVVALGVLIVALGVTREMR